MALVPEGQKIFGRRTVLENLEMGAFTRSDFVPLDRADSFLILQCPFSHPGGNEIDLVIAQIRSANRHWFPHHFSSPYLSDQFAAIRISWCDDRTVDAARHHPTVGVEEQALRAAVAHDAPAQEYR